MHQFFEIKSYCLCFCSCLWTVSILNSTIKCNINCYAFWTDETCVFRIAAFHCHSISFIRYLLLHSPVHLLLWTHTQNWVRESEEKIEVTTATRTQLSAVEHNHLKLNGSIWMAALTIVFQKNNNCAHCTLASIFSHLAFHRNNNYSEWSFQHYCRRYLSLSALYVRSNNIHAYNRYTLPPLLYRNKKKKNFCWLRISVFRLVRTFILSPRVYGTARLIHFVVSQFVLLFLFTNSMLYRATRLIVIFRVRYTRSTRGCCRVAAAPWLFNFILKLISFIHKMTMLFKNVGQ